MGSRRAAEAVKTILTIDEVASILRISRQSAYEAARRGEIPTLKIGRRILVPRVALDRLIASAGPLRE